MKPWVRMLAIGYVAEWMSAGEDRHGFYDALTYALQTWDPSEERDACAEAIRMLNRSLNVALGTR